MTALTETLERTVADYVDGTNIAIAISRFDRDDFPLMHVNDAFCRLSGYSREEILGQNCRFMQGNRRDQPVRARIRDFLHDTEQNSIRCQIVNVRKSGEAFVNFLMMAKLTDHDRRLKYVFGSQFDVGAADEDALDRYDATLRTQLQDLGNLTSQYDVFMQGTLLAMGSGAAQIAQAKLLISGLS